MVTRINEMAYKRSVAVDRCASLGKQFVRHFNKTCALGKYDNDFQHHCHEMQTWYEDAASIKLKETRKSISKIDLIDWFFTIGQSTEDIINEPYQDIYEQMILDVLSGKTVYNSLDSLL